MVGTKLEQGGRWKNLAKLMVWSLCLMIWKILVA